MFSIHSAVKNLQGWIRGLISSLLLLLMAAVTYVTWGSAGPIKSAIALLCAATASALVLILIYAIEKDDFRSGAAIPFVALLGLLAGYFGQPPFELTLGLCVLASILVIILVQEGD